MRTRRAQTAAIIAWALAVAACAARRPDAPSLPQTRALLAADGSNTDAGATIGALAAVVDRVRSALAASPGLLPSQVLSRVVFEELKFEREVDDASPRFMQLGSVLQSRRGSCVGLGALFLALGEWLGPAAGFSVEGVLVPGHFFVRLTDRAGVHNIELLRRGERMPDSWYPARFKVPTGALAYLRALTTREIAAVFAYNLGNDSRLRGQLPEAKDFYQRATRDFPQFAEAQASLGLVLQLVGNLPDAERAYSAARAANAALPGLDANLNLLHAERTQP